MIHMLRTLRVGLFAAFLLLSLLQSQYVGTAEATAYRSWVTVDVISFDGESITARITLKAAGNHENDTVRLLGATVTSQEENRACIASICVRSAVTATVWRIVQEITFSSDTNITSFQYTQQWVSAYKPNTFLPGLPSFPLDEHQLDIGIRTNFKADIDSHEKIPGLPTANYEGFYQVREVASQDPSQYEYELSLHIRHSEAFKTSMLLWTWGVIFVLGLITVGLALQWVFSASRETEARDLITASSAVMVFIPVFELTLQNFKAPLGMTLSDAFLFLIMLANVFLPIAVLRRWSGRRYGMILAVSLLVFFGIWFLRFNFI